MKKLAIFVLWALYCTASFGSSAGVDIWRSGGVSPLANVPVTVYFNPWQNPGCPQPTAPNLWYGVNGKWAVLSMTGEVSCAPFNNGGSGLFAAAIPGQPAGTKVEYVVEAGGYFYKAGSEPAYNSWQVGYTWYGATQNFHYVAERLSSRTHTWPQGGQIRQGETLWINCDITPRSLNFKGLQGNLSHVAVVYTTDGIKWQSKELKYELNPNSYDHYYANMGTFLYGAQIRFCVLMIDHAGNQYWDNNGGKDYTISVVAGDPLKWLGNTYHWPFNGQITKDKDLWVNCESWPKGAGVSGTVVYSADNGASWKSAVLQKNGVAGNNDAWHVNLSRFAAGTVIRYAVMVKDANAKEIWDNNGGKDYRAVVNP